MEDQTLVVSDYGRSKKRSASAIGMPFTLQPMFHVRRVFDIILLFLRSLPNHTSFKVDRSSTRKKRKSKKHVSSVSNDIDGNRPS